MAFGIFIHRPDSGYDDTPAEQYQFPRQYLSRAKQMVGGWIVYYEPTKAQRSRGYFAVAQVERIVPDPKEGGMFVAHIAPGTYLDFGSPVPFTDDDGVVERGLLNDMGNISGRAQAAIRPLSPTDFARILERGLGNDLDTLPRLDPPAGFADEQAPFTSPRDRIAQISNRAVRDRNFRKIVLDAYGERCAITGLRLINGGGRAEVQAAHIRPVEENGPDIVSNGLALSGTTHWMFDRGLIGVAPDHRILISRQANDPDSIKTLINPTGLLLCPEVPAMRPAQKFLDWHHQHRFKA